MSTAVLTLVSLILATALVVVWSRWRRAQRAEYIRHYDFPPGLIEKLRQRRPQLGVKDGQLVAHALRQFFLAHLNSGRRFVSMPSQVADDLWHEFILYTQHYGQFCQKAFGRFMHHSPAVVLGSVRASNTGLRRCWWYTCLEENINPRQATRLPLLFALDAKLGIEDGFRYVADCQGLRRQNDDGSSSPVYCGSDMSSSSFDGGTDGFGDSAGDGGGDASGGCGGGCGGGGD